MAAEVAEEGEEDHGKVVMEEADACRMVLVEDSGARHKLMMRLTLLKIDHNITNNLFYQLTKLLHLYHAT